MKRLLWAPIVMLAVTAAQAQVTTATFYGTVTDSSGALIPGATVTLLHAGTGITATKTTDETGNFVFDFLRVGSYTVTIEVAGFKTYRSSGIALTAGQQIRQTFRLDVGTVTETVEVEASALAGLVRPARDIQSHTVTAGPIQGWKHC